MAADGNATAFSNIIKKSWHMECVSIAKKKTAMRSYSIGIWNTIVSNPNCEAWQNKCQKGKPLPKTVNGMGSIAGPLFVAPCNHAMGGITQSILAMDFLIKLQVIQIGHGSLPFQAWSWIQACGCWLHNVRPLFIGIWGHGRHGIISSWLWQQEWHIQLECHWWQAHIGSLLLDPASLHLHLGCWKWIFLPWCKKIGACKHKMALAWSSIEI